MKSLIALFVIVAVHFLGKHQAYGQGQKERGTWDVSVNKDKGRGPQVHSEASGNIYTSPNGKWKVDAQGHHEFGKGRKPDYGGGVKVSGRWRRSLDDNDVENVQQDDVDRMKRSLNPVRGPSNSDASRGSWGVSVNKDKGRGPQIKTEGRGNVYSSPKGDVKVDVHGRHEMGKGRKPDYGVGGSVSGRWRREAEVTVEEVDTSDFDRQKRSANPQNGQRGSVGVTINHDRGTGPQVRTDARGNIYTSKNGNWRVDGTGHHEFGRGRKPDYGVGVQVQGRFRRSVDEEEIADEDALDQETELIRIVRSTQPGASPFPRPNGGSGDRGTWGVSVNKDKGRGPQVHTEVGGNIYTSPKGNWKVDGQGHHEFGKGRKPDYGVGVQVQGRWRRSIDEGDTDFVPIQDEGAEGELLVDRSKRSPDPQDKKTHVSVSVNKDQGRGPQIRTDVQRNIYTSPNKNWNLSGQGYHEFGKGRKPSYGGMVTLSRRF